MRKNKKITVGIIGKNFGYNVILKALYKSKLFSIKSFCVRNKKNLPNFPKKIRVLTDWKKLVSNKETKAIIVAIPPYLQKKILIFAAKNNKHIFCEKPCTKSLDDLKRVSNLMNSKTHFISHMVNYNLAYLPAFQFLKKKILNKKIEIKEIDLEWIIFNKNRNKSWKNHHEKGGGILFNFYCHSLYYIELLFGEISSTKLNIKNNVKSNDNFVVGDITLTSGIKVKIKLLVGSLNKHKKSVHQLKIKTDKNNYYLLSSSTKNLNDQFQLYKIKNTRRQKSKRALFKAKPTKKDFRINPTLVNLKRFAASIHNQRLDRSSFFKANRIHYLLNQSVISSKKKKRVTIN
tara:strand:+ start:101 stop:1138 length:1038 start_codon:yes stop_codon:yes gene_type:complete